MNTAALLLGKALLAIGALLLLHTLVTSRVDPGRRVRVWQLLTALALFAGAGVLIASLDW
jgi:hypothetical protein